MTGLGHSFELGVTSKKVYALQTLNDVPGALAILKQPGFWPSGLRQVLGPGDFPRGVDGFRLSSVALNSARFLIYAAVT